MFSQPLITGEFDPQHGLAKIAGVEAEAARTIKGRLIATAFPALRLYGIEGARGWKWQAAAGTHRTVPRLQA